MKKILSLIIVSAIVFGLAGTTHAALINYGGGLIYDTDLNITWLQDANYAHTRMNWEQSMLWADQLQYGGYSDWRLPTSPCTMSGFTNEGELGHLYYTELGNSAYGPLTNIGPFIMQPPRGYWLGSPGVSSLSQWEFNFDIGNQNAVWKGEQISAWAVRDGGVGPAVKPTSPYITTLMLGNTLSFDYWWEMGNEPQGFNLDVLFFRDGEWRFLGWELNFDGSSTGWETASFVVPGELRGLETQIRFSVFDLGAETDPTVYLRNITAVPEPSTMLLLGSGLLGLWGFRKKFKK